MQKLMKLVLILFIFAICTIAHGEHALFNGLPVDTARNANSYEAFMNVRSLLEKGEPQNLIVEFKVDLEPLTANESGLDTIKMDIHERATIFKGIKSSVFRTLDSADVEQIKDYTYLPMGLMRVYSIKGLDLLMEHPQVKAVFEDKKRKLFLNESLPLINQPEAQNQDYTGAGTSIAIIDSGVDYTHPAFGSCSSPGVPSTCKVIYAQDFAPEDYIPDDNGHGTNVAGIALGVAPGTKIIALDVADGESLYDSDIISAITWVLGNRSTYNIVAINLSLGSGRYFSSCNGTVYSTPVSSAKALGIFVAAASGNNAFKDSMAMPACDPNIVSVGAVYDANMGPITWEACSDYNPAVDKVTCFSNSASFLDLIAPGALITAAGFTKGGTSQATPHVAGAAAVMAQAYPGETVSQWLEHLRSTGVPVTDSANGITKPRIDLYAAVNDATPPEPGFINLSGIVKTLDGTPLCAMVLANGKHVFSCDGSGNYSLDVPLDDKGLVTLQVFASGFAPYRVSLTSTQAVGYIVYMARDTSGRAFRITHTETSSSPSGWAIVSGTIDDNGTPLCAMILINGKSTFSCNANLGRYSLNVPLGINGNITLQAFVAGFQPYRETFPGPSDKPFNQVQTERLIGTWDFFYTIISTFNDTYRLPGPAVESTSIPGDYRLFGFDTYGNDDVVAAYDSDFGDFVLLDLGISFDQFYTFDFTGADTIKGCYYLVRDGTDFSPCYPLNGFRISMSIMHNLGIGEGNPYSGFSQDEKEALQYEENLSSLAAVPGSAASSANTAPDVLDLYKKLELSLH